MSDTNTKDAIAIAAGNKEELKARLTAKLHEEDAKIITLNNDGDVVANGYNEDEEIDPVIDPVAGLNKMTFKPY